MDKKVEKNPFPRVDLQNLQYNHHLEMLRKEFSPNLSLTKQETWYFNSIQGIKLFVRHWTHINGKQPKGNIIIFHGFSGHGEYFVLIADQLVVAGYDVYVFDYPGHGLSEGVRGDVKSFSLIIDDARQFIDKIYSKDPTIPLFLSGESMGGTVLANLIISYPELPPIKGLIFFAPGVKLKATGFSFKDIIKIIPPILLYPFNPGRLAMYMRNNNNPVLPNGKPLMHPVHFEYDRTNPLHLNYVSMRYLLQLKKGFDRAFKLGPEAVKHPSLIIYGTNDIAIDRNGVESFYSRIQHPDKKILFIEGSPHSVFTSIEFQPYWQQIIEWLNVHVI